MQINLSFPILATVFVLSGMGVGLAQEQPDMTSARVAQVIVDKAKVYTMEAEKDDVSFPFQLNQGDQVLVLRDGESCQGVGVHFCQVRVPGGVSGFVHGKYLKKVVDEDGWGEISSRKLYLRTSPDSNRLPAATLVKGTRLRLLKQDGDWWKVMAPEEFSGWVRIKDLRILGPVASFEKQLDQTRKARLKVWHDLLDAKKLLAVLKKNREAVMADLAPILELIVQEEAKDYKKGLPATQSQYQLALAKIEKLLAAFKLKHSPASLKELGLADNMGQVKARFDHQCKLFAAEKFLSQPESKPGPKPKSPDSPVSLTKKPVGYLRRLATPFYNTSYVLKKGDQVICYIKCNSGRYALADFKNCYIEVDGLVTTPGSLGGKQLIDLDRLIILHHP